MITYFGSASNPTTDGGSLASTTPVAVTPPGSMTKGQLVLMIGQCRDTTTPTINVTGGQTWSSLALIAANNVHAVIFYCTFNGTWAANPSVNLGNGVGVSDSVFMHVFTPTKATNKWMVDVAQQTSTYGAVTVLPITGQTTVKNSTVSFAGWMIGQNYTYSSLTGSGWTTTGLAQYRNAGGNNQSATFAHKIQIVAGATGNVQVTQSTANANGPATVIVTFAELPFRPAQILN
jgi:hypothetical protein